MKILIDNGHGENTAGKRSPDGIFREYKYAREIAEAIEKTTAKFAGEGRVLIRPSGTEPLVRVMIEGKDQAMIEQEAKALAELIQNVML